LNPIITLTNVINILPLNCNERIAVSSKKSQKLLQRSTNNKQFGTFVMKCVLNRDLTKVLKRELKYFRRHFLCPFLHVNIVPSVVPVVHKSVQKLTSGQTSSNLSLILPKHEHGTQKISKHEHGTQNSLQRIRLNRLNGHRFSRTFVKFTHVLGSYELQ
jgi:predicted nucleic acid binding AN1-type Zn finger protein